MTVSNEANGTASVTLNTPETLTTVTTAGVYVLTIDLGNMVSGDTLTVDADVKTLTGSTAATAMTTTFTDAQAPAVQQSIAVLVEHSCAFVIEQTAGTARSFDWSVASA